MLHAKMISYYVRKAFAFLYTNIYLFKSNDRKKQKLCFYFGDLSTESDQFPQEIVELGFRRRVLTWLLK